MIWARAGWVALVGALLWAGAASAEDKWETVLSGPLTVKVRVLEGGVQEVLAEGEMSADLQAIATALQDPESYPRWMPHVKDCRKLGTPEPDGSQLLYTQVVPPIVSARDYITRVRAQGSDTAFRQSWVAVNDKLPVRRGITRITRTEGSWTLSARGEGRTWAVYRFVVDPGGWIPGFVRDAANRQAVPDAFRAVEKEARRRAKAGLAVGGSGAGGAAPAPAPATP